MNILISSLGLNAEIVEEALGLFNFSVFDFYASSPEQQERANGVRKSMGLNNETAIDEVWLVATDKEHTEVARGKVVYSAIEDFKYLEDNKQKYGVKYKLFVLDGIKDIVEESDARAYHDLTLRVVAKAHQVKGDGKLYVSLACGRKTMSTDMQDAAYCFGCDGLIHILGNNINDSTPLFLGAVTGNETIRINDIQLPDGEIVKVSPSHTTLTDIEEQKKKSLHFYTTYYLDNEDRNNFHVLYTLPPSKVKELKEELIGIDPTSKLAELEYLKRLPKTELHCHLGGVLSPSEMVDVAQCYIPFIQQETTVNPLYKEWLSTLPKTVEAMQSRPISWKQWYNDIATSLGVHKGLVVAPFLLQFKNRTQQLHNLIYEGYATEEEFMGISIDQYEKLGDLQGSALLCNEQALRRTVQILLNNCIKENVKYIEVRCSPVNYSTTELTPTKIMNTILEELEEQQDAIQASVILIASRHADSSKIDESIKLVRDMKDNRLFNKYFRGFDLAGAEDKGEAKNFRDKFLEIMRDCCNITIHAGENVECESIWQAVYYLNAERIGHGLTLVQNEELQNKFLDRSIGIEMCPSSNYQIVGYQDNYIACTSRLNIYPLKAFLNKELPVSINTDDPGISLTNITQELHKAARMTPGGLSKWEILQLLCNGFRTAFFPHDKKKKLIAKAEAELGKLIRENKL